MRLIDADKLVRKCMNGLDNEFIALVNDEPTVQILDKIRADVVNIADSKQSIKVRSVLRIIDKYRKEQE